MNKLLSLELEVKGKDGQVVHFNSANWVTTASTTNDFCSIPLSLTSDWNSVTFDIQTLCNKVFGISFGTLERIRIHGSCRIRRIFLSDKYPNEFDLPAELQLYAPD